MKQLSILAVSMLAVVLVNGQNKKEKDVQAIKKMCGCYEVSFNFSETFSYTNDSTYVASKVKHDKGLEWVELVSEENDKLVLQHLLIVGKPTKQHIIKHWRQDWLFENTDLYTYDVNNRWKYSKFNKNQVTGQWTQKVFQVDDSPRYEGSATWVHVDGKSYWENTTDAPLPRREYTKRSDYNVTVRSNRHEITANGWIHDQDNDKVIRETEKEDIVLAQEKGINQYIKVSDERCKAAQDWWKENHTSWKLVRAKWDTIFAQNTDLTLKSKVDNKALYTYLFDKNFVKSKSNIDKIIAAFILK